MQDVFRKLNLESGVGSTTLAESRQYKITNEYETVCLEDKINHRKNVIGDFYGDPEGAFIDRNERFAVIYGCGIIVYFLHPPFADYAYSIQSDQWLEIGRDHPIIWVHKVIQKDAESIEIFPEDGDSFTVFLDNN